MKTLNKNITRIIGLKLSGFNSKHTSLSVLDYYKDQKRIFLLKTIPYLKSKKKANYDNILINLLDEFSSDFNTKIITNAPLNLPPCITCNTSCRGVNNCKDIEVNKMIKKTENLKSSTISPYIKRLEDLWLEEQNPGVEKTHDALSSNLAPILGRIRFLEKNLTNFKNITFFESKVDFILHEIVKYFRIPDSYLKNYKSIIIGKRIRTEIINKLQKHIFIYTNDLDVLIKYESIFQAFLLSICGLFKVKEKVKTFRKVIIPSNIKF